MMLGGKRVISIVEDDTDAAQEDDPVAAVDDGRSFRCDAFCEPLALVCGGGGAVPSPEVTMKESSASASSSSSWMLLDPAAAAATIPFCGDTSSGSGVRAGEP